MKKFLLIALNIFIFLELPTLAMSDEIVIGQTINRSGEFKKYARAIQAGIEACFKNTNQRGGVNGKQLRLESHDDKGDPTIAHSLIADMQRRGIDMFLGCMGSRSILGLLPEIQRGSISMLFPWGDDPKLRNAKLQHLINGTGFLETQVEKLAHYAYDELRIEKIALFHADDPFSTNGAQQLKNSLIKRNITPISVATYNRLTQHFTKPAHELLKTDPKIVACVGTSMPLVKLVKTFFAHGSYNTIFLGIDSTFMTRDILGDMGAKVYFTSTVPNPKTSQLPIAREFITSLKEYDATAIPNVLSFSYYIFTKLFIEALQATKNRADLMTHFEKVKNYSIGGFTINFDSANRHLTGTSIYLIKD